MERKDLIKKFEELKKHYYDEYTFNNDEDSLDTYVYLKNLDTNYMSIEELSKVVDEYDF